MAWIESHQTLRNHPKTKRFARILGVSLPQAIGHLHMLWWWAMDYATDGELTKFDIEDISDAAGWEGDPAALINALENCGVKGGGFIDRIENNKLVIHDWDDYIGKLLTKREEDRQRKIKHRAAKKDKEQNESTPQEIETPVSSELLQNVTENPGQCPQDVRRTSTGRPTDGARTAHVPYLPYLPYRTVPYLPYRTVPYLPAKIRSSKKSRQAE